MQTTPPETTRHSTDDTLLRLDDVLARVPVSRAHWYRAVRRGDAPQPIHMGRTSLWRASDVSAWIATLGEARASCAAASSLRADA